MPVLSPKVHKPETRPKWLVLHTAEVREAFQDPKMGTLRTLSPKVCRYDLLWALKYIDMTYFGP